MSKALSMANLKYWSLEKGFYSPSTIILVKKYTNYTLYKIKNLSDNLIRWQQNRAT